MSKKEGYAGSVCGEGKILQKFLFKELKIYEKINKIFPFKGKKNGEEEECTKGKTILS